MEVACAVRNGMEVACTPPDENGDWNEIKECRENLSLLLLLC